MKKILLIEGKMQNKNKVEIFDLIREFSVRLQVTYKEQAFIFTK